MVFLGKRHLHIPESDHIVDGLVGLLSSANSGSIKLEFANKPVAEIGIFIPIILAIVARRGSK